MVSVDRAAVAAATLTSSARQAVIGSSSTVKISCFRFRALGSDACCRAALLLRAVRARASRRTGGLWNSAYLPTGTR